VTAARRGLGRGLDALLTSPEPGDDAGPADEGLRYLDTASIVPNPEQPRREFDEDALEALAQSIRVHGLLQPVVVEPAGAGFQLVAGERRLRAARRAGLATIPAVIRPASESARQALELALTENLVRAELSALEEAAAYARLADAFGLSHDSIALRVGRSRSAVSNTIRLLNLAAGVQVLLAEGRLTPGQARPLLALADHEAQERLAQRAVEEGWSARQIEGAVQEPQQDTPAPARSQPRELSVDDAALQTGFEAALGTSVQLQRRRRGGRLIIDFHDDELLGELYRRMGGGPL
jgi:ParB family chromosome partitioning protein